MKGPDHDRWAVKTSSERSPDGRFELRHEIEPGPRDDFYGVAEHRWELVQVATGRPIGSFQGEEYDNHWTGVTRVRFSEDGRAVLVGGRLYGYCRLGQNLGSEVKQEWVRLFGNRPGPEVQDQIAHYETPAPDVERRLALPDEV